MDSVRSSENDDRSRGRDDSTAPGGTVRVACVGDGQATAVLENSPATTVTQVCRAEEVTVSGVDCVVVTSTATVPAAIEQVCERHPAVPTVACTRDPAVVDRVRETATEFFRPPPENGEGWALLSRRVTTAVERARKRRRRGRERRLRRLVGVTRDLLTADSREAVAETTSEAAGEVLSFAGTDVRLHDPETDLLRSVSVGASVETDERSPYPVDAPHGRAFRSGETVVESVDSDDPYDRDPFEEVMYVPIGEYGLLSVGVTEGELTPTDRRLAESLAASSEVAFRRQERDRELLVRTRAMTVADVGFVLLDDGSIAWANEGFAAITGYDREAVVGRGVGLFEAPETDPETVTRLREAVTDAEPEPASLAIQSRRADGTPFWARVEITPVTDATGDPTRRVCSVTDITPEVRRERRLEALAATKRSLAAAETTADVVSAVRTADLGTLDFAGVGVRRYDPETERLVPVATNGDVPGDGPRRPVDLDSPQGRAYRTEETVAQVAPGNGDGSESEVPYDEVLYVPVEDHGVLSVAGEGTTDEVDRRLAELLGTGVAAALDRARRRDTLELYGDVIETTQGMVYATDGDGRLTLVTEPLAATVGVDPETLVGTPAAETLAPEVTAVDVDGRVETTLSRPDGETPVAVDVSPLSDGGVVGIVHDRSELAATRDELDAERERIEVLFEHMPDPVCEVRLEADSNVLVEVNQAFESTFGYDREELVGTDLNERIVPEDQVEVAESLDDRARDGGAVTETVRRVTADGVRDFLFHGVPFGTDGRRRAFGVYVDISEQKRRERRLEVLNRVLRHNVRNKTTVVRGYAELVADRVDGLDPNSETAIARLREASAEIADISDVARSVQRCLEREVSEPVELVPVVEALARQYRDDADVRLDLPAALPASTSGSAELALDQLLENAAEHVASPTVRIAGENENGRVRLRVTDDGPGIPDDELSVVTGDRTTTQLEHASGLGLWAVRWVVENDGGTVRFETPETDEVGTRVTLDLPADDSATTGDRTGE